MTNHDGDSDDVEDTHFYNQLTLLILFVYLSLGKREHEYEVVWEGKKPWVFVIEHQTHNMNNITIITMMITTGQLKENTWHTRTELKEMGYEKLMNQKDEQIAMESMLGQRKLTTGKCCLLMVVAII